MHRMTSRLRAAGIGLRVFRWLKRRAGTTQIQVAGDRSIQIQSGADICLSASNNSLAALNIDGSVTITPDGIFIHKS